MNRKFDLSLNAKSKIKNISQCTSVKNLFHPFDFTAFYAGL